MFVRQHWFTAKDIFYSFLVSNPFVSFYYPDEKVFCFYDSILEKVFYYDPELEDTYLSGYAECDFFKFCTNLKELDDVLNFKYSHFD